MNDINYGEPLILHVRVAAVVPSLIWQQLYDVYE